MKWIRPPRVHEAIIALSAWRHTAQSQSAMHLLQLIPLLQRGATAGTAVRYEEDNDREFWDVHFQLPGNEQEPYFDPLTRDRRIRTHYHSNVATARKNTFANRWGAANYEQRPDDETWWTLAPGWSEVFARRALTKAGVTHRVPVLELAIVLYRKESWPDEANARTVEERFRQSLAITDEEYDRVFIFEDEDPARIFTADQPELSAYDDAIAEALIPRAEATINNPAQPEGAPPETSIPDDDDILLQIRELLGLRSSGIILRGIPGTGKTWYARQIARKLTAGDDDRIRRVQFHPAYSYENFVEGYIPDQNSASGFDLVNKIFLKACADASESDSRFVFIIDEINRGDPARVFGEVLTYIERDYRDEKFDLPYSGAEASIPENLLILGTMNPQDRSIAQLDQAFLRRFDHIDLYPSSEVAANFLEQGGGFTPTQITEIVRWFENLQRIVPDGIGHAYLRHVNRPEDLLAIWKYRMLPYCRMVTEFEPTRLKSAQDSFEAMYARVIGRGVAE